MHLIDCLYYELCFSRSYTSDCRLPPPLPLSNVSSGMPRILHCWSFLDFQIFLIRCKSKKKTLEAPLVCFRSADRFWYIFYWDQIVSRACVLARLFWHAMAGLSVNRPIRLEANEELMKSNVVLIVNLMTSKIVYDRG